MEKNYREINKETYNNLANEYSSRKYEIGHDYWFNIYKDIKLSRKDKLEFLEIGPGIGRNIKIFQKYNSNSEITAIEFSKNMCEIIKKENPNIKIINEDIIDYDFENKKYDIIQMIAFIHLFPKEDAIKILNKIYDVLKDNGHLIIDTTIHDIEEEGFFVKSDYDSCFKRFRHKYTKESFEDLLKKSKFKIFKSYSIKEKDRNKVWYDIVAKKN